MNTNLLPDGVSYEDKLIDFFFKESMIFSKIIEGNIETNYKVQNVQISFNSSETYFNSCYAENDMFTEEAVVFLVTFIEKNTGFYRIKKLYFNKDSSDEFYNRIYHCPKYESVMTNKDWFIKQIEQEVIKKEKSTMENVLDFITQKLNPTEKKKVHKL